MCENVFQSNRGQRVAITIEYNHKPLIQSARNEQHICVYSEIEIVLKNNMSTSC